jgi:protein disulfide-isomerase A1
MALRVVLLIATTTTAIKAEDITEEENVLVLNANNFEEAIKNNKFIMVEFYSLRCGHCEALAPEYSKAAEELKNEGSEIKLAKIDAVEYLEIARAYDVGGYPTLKFFRSGVAIRYKRERTSHAMINWMKSRTGPSAATLLSIDQTKAYVDSNDVVIVGFFSDTESFAAKNFFQAAEEMDNYGYKFGITSDSDVFNNYDIKEDTIVLFKSFDEGRKDLKLKPFSVIDLKIFILPNSIPLLTDFDTNIQDSRERFQRIADSKKGVFYLIVSYESNQFSSLNDLIEKISKEYKGKMYFTIMDSGIQNNKPFINNLGVLEDDEVPAMRFVKSWSTKYIPDSPEITEDSIKKFIDSSLIGNAKQMAWKKSVAIPADWDKKPVKVLVGKNFYDAVSSQKHSFVKFYAPWCGHCKSLVPIWEELAEKFKDREDIMIAKMDATVNQLEYVKVGSFPTIYLYKHSPSNSIKYQESRTMDGFLKFLEGQGIQLEDKRDKKDEL